MRKLSYALILSTSLMAAGAASAQNTVMVGGQSMLPSKDIVDNAVNSKDHTTLVAAVKAAGLVETLKGKGPFTVFAPTNAAFAAALTELGITKAALFANVPLLTKVLTYHVVGARVLKAEIPATPIATVQGETFTINSAFVLTDQRDRKTNITATDVFASNGVIHTVDRVILPKA